MRLLENGYTNSSIWIVYSTKIIQINGGINVRKRKSDNIGLVSGIKDEIRGLRNGGFTIIELIVVMAVIAILVLMAAPKYLGYTQKAKQTQTINDAKVIENAVDEYLFTYEVFPNELLAIDTEAFQSVIADGKLVDASGMVSTFEDTNPYYELTDSFVRDTLDVKTKIKGIIYSSKDGRVLVKTEKALYPEPVKEVSVTSIEYLNSLKPTIDSSTVMPSNFGEVTADGYFEFNSTTGAITNYYLTGKSGSLPQITDVVIPSSISGVTVKSIGGAAFAGKNLTSIYVPPTVSSIGGGAFGQSLAFTKVIIPDSLTNPISPYNTDAVFKGSSIEELVVYKGDGAISLAGVLKGYPSGTSYSVQRVSKVTIMEGVLDVPYGTFSALGINSLVLGNGLLTIGGEAFSGNSITMLQLPDSLTSIGAGAFRGNQIQELYLPASVNVGSNAFAQSTIFTKIILPDSLNNGISNYNTDAIFKGSSIDEVILYKGAGTNSLNGVFAGYDISGGLTYSVKRVGKLTIMDGVTSIPYMAFKGMGMSELIMGDGLLTINGYAFAYNNLTAVKFPNSLTSIGSFAFAGNQILELYLPSFVNAGPNAFNQSTVFVKVTVPDSLNNPISPSNTDAIFRGSSIDEVIVYKGDGINSLAGVFKGYDNGTSYSTQRISKLTIMDGITTIPYMAFRNMGVTSLNLGAGLVTISDYAFDSNKITNVILPDSVTYVGNSAFRGNNLLELYVSDGATIKANAFSSSTITKVTIPDSLSNPISPSNTDAIFKGSSIDEVTLYKGAGATSLAGVFKGYPSGTSYSANGISKIIIEDGMTSIPGESLNYGGVVSVIIPSNITLQSTSIGNGFSNFYNSNGKASGTYLGVSGAGGWYKK